MTTPRPAPPRTTYRSVLAGREPKVLFGTVLLYGLGFSFEILGLSVLVYARTSSPFLAALAFGIGFLPQLAGGMVLTSLADRYSARGVVAVGLVVRAAPGLAIGLVPTMPVGAMLALVGATALAAPVFTAAIGGLLPELLDGDRYVVGRSMMTMISSGTQITGLGLGGAILALVASPDLLLAAGAALLVSAVVARVGLRWRAPRATGPAAGSVLRATLRGNRALLARTEVRGLLLAQWLPVMCVTGAEALIVPYVGSLGRPEGTASALLAALPVGMLLGDLTVGRLCRPATRSRLAFPLAVLIGIPLLVFAASPPVPAAAGLLLLTGTGLAYTLGIQQAFLDSLPESLRGQGFGLLSTGLMGGQGVTPPLAGALAAYAGVGVAMATGGALALATALTLRSSLRSHSR